MASTEQNIVTEKPKRRWFQFSLRTLLVLVTLTALALGGWQCWKTIRPMWELYSIVTQSDDLSPDEKALLQKLAWNREAWESGLIRNLGGILDVARAHDLELRSRMKHTGRTHDLELWEAFRSRMKWSGNIADVDGSVYRIFLFRRVSFTNPAELSGLTCIVTDDEYGLQVWKVIAHRCSVIESASVEPRLPSVLRITCWCDPLIFKESYRYKVSPESIEQLE